LARLGVGTDVVEMEHEGLVDSPAATGAERACCALAFDGRIVRLEGRACIMTATASTQTNRLSWAGIAGLAVGAVCVLQTGLVAAFPSAVGLTMLAVSDYRTRHVPREVVARSAVAIMVLGVLDAAVRADGQGLARATVTTAIVTLVAGLVWAVTSGIAFGDVKLLALASFVPAWIRGSAVLTMVLVALMTAVGMVVVERVRVGGLTMKSSIAFGPALLVGWLVGVLMA
jgi:hypothetical protein